MLLLVAALGVAAGGFWFMDTYLDGENPYGHSPITYRVEGGVEFEETVLEALGFWERGGDGKLGFDVVFMEAVEGTQPDIVIRFEPTRTVTCGVWRVEAAGCGGVVAGKGFATVATAQRTEPIVYDLLVHEVGHAIGRLHTRDADSPMWVQADGRPWWLP